MRYLKGRQVPSVWGSGLSGLFRGSGLSGLFSPGKRLMQSVVRFLYDAGGPYEEGGRLRSMRRARLRKKSEARKCALQQRSVIIGVLAKLRTLPLSRPEPEPEH